jgi:hypothetical protein
LATYLQKISPSLKPKRAGNGVSHRLPARGKGHVSQRDQKRSVTGKSPKGAHPRRANAKHKSPGTTSE